MKVALELQPCLKNRSGIGVYTYELSRRLQQFEDLELAGDIFNFLGRNDLTIDLKHLDFEQATCKLFPYGVYRRVWHYVPLKYNTIFKREADITHFFNFIVPPRIQGKIVNTVHDLTFEFYPETMDRKNLKRLKTDIHYSLERANKIVTISECSRKDIIEVLKVDPAKIEIVYPGVDYDYFNAMPSNERMQQVRSKYNLPDEYILYMGTLEPRKNIPSIIEAYYKLKKGGDKKVQSIKLVLAGKKGWLYEEIFNKVKELGLEEDVVFTDYVDESDKAIIYKLASLFVFPSLYEGFGIPVLEAMASSTPVIASNASSLPEVAGNAALLVNPQDTLSMAEGMHSILTKEEYRDIMVQKGHTQAQKFNWEDSAHKLYELYQSL